MYFFNKLLILSALCVSIGLAQNPRIGSCPALPPSDIWNTAVDQLPIAPNSTTYISRIGATAPLHPDFGSGVYNGGLIGIPFITVTGAQKYPATFDYASESDPGPYAVPLNAPIEGGSQSTGDRHAIAIDTSNCILYELYAAYPQAASWKAGSGAIYNLRSSALRTLTWTSADAAGLPIFPGLIRYDEIQAGEIRHAIRFTVPKTQRAYVWPARHYASSITDPSYPPMGARFRLRASFDISGYSPVNQIILKALKKYGMMIADNGSAWFISGAPDPAWNNDDLHKLTALRGFDFEAVDVSHLMVNPNSGEAAQNGISVTVVPSTASVTLNGARQFLATVTGSTDQTVTWSVNGSVGGNSVTGWVDATGRYTAPNLVPTPATVTVEATSRTVPAVTGSAVVTILAPVTITPLASTLRIGRQQQFRASVPVTWSASAGAISASGLYRAPSTVPSPATVIITARSLADSTASATASVTIIRR